MFALEEPKVTETHTTLEQKPTMVPSSGNMDLMWTSSRRNSSRGPIENSPTRPLLLWIFRQAGPR